jgi:hypothetical protein
MEPAHALADLRAALPQVEAATIFDYYNRPLGSLGVAGSAATVARAGRALLMDAAQFRGVGEATQVHASLADGDVFVVSARGGQAIVAVTAPRQPAGVLFHDLKRCLASIAEAPE